MKMSNRRFIHRMSGSRRRSIFSPGKPGIGTNFPPLTVLQRWRSSFVAAHAGGARRGDAAHDERERERRIRPGALRSRSRTSIGALNRQLGGDLEIVQDRWPTPAPISGRHPGAAAGLVEGGLRQDRHRAQIVGEQPVRDRRRPPRPARPRRGLRGRQRRARRRAALRRGGRARLRARAARARRERAAAEGFEVEFVEGDAQELPFDDARSTSSSRPSARCSRPTRRRRPRSCCGSAGPAGKIGMANWPPAAWSVAASSGRSPEHAPPPPGVDPPSLWGTEERLRELFGDGSRSSGRAQAI